MADVLDTIVARIVAAVQPDRIILFGSRGRGDDTPDSDYDILVLKRGVGHRRSLAQTIYVQLADISAPVDIIVEDLDHVERYRDTPGYVYNDALKGRVVYER